MLADYVAKRELIELDGTSFSVGGVSFNGLTQLINTHFADLDAIISLAKEAVNGDIDNVSQGSIESLVLSAVSDAPGFIANLIAVAAGETSEKAVQAAAAIAAPKQIEIVLKIVKLTFEEVGGVKKGMEVVANLLTSSKTEEETPSSAT